MEGFEEDISNYKEKEKEEISVILKPYIKDLSSKDENIRKKAVKFLSKTGNPEVVKPLIENAVKEDISFKKLVLNAIIDIYEDYFLYENHDKFKAKESSDLIKILLFIEWALYDEVTWRVKEILNKFDFQKALQTYIRDLHKEGKFENDTAKEILFELFGRCYDVWDFYMQEDICLALIDSLEIEDENVQNVLIEIIKEIEYFGFYTPYLDLFKKSNDLIKTKLALLLIKVHREGGHLYDDLDNIEVIKVLQDYVMDKNPKVRRATIAAVSVWLQNTYRSEKDSYEYLLEDGIDKIKLMDIYEKEKDAGGKVRCKKCPLEFYVIERFCSFCGTELDTEQFEGSLE